MLRSLVIKDFILIEKLELDFDSSFAVITGETGAGKSILLDAILFCFGASQSGEVIRQGSDSCFVALYISPSDKIISYLQTHELEFTTEDDIVLKRTQNLAGKKKFLINDQPVTAKIINGLFDLCLEINGQHNHTSLLNSSRHLDILDEYGKFFTLRQEISTIYSTWQKTEREITDVLAQKDNIAKEIDYLEHTIQELDKVNVLPGEEEKLSELKHKLQNKDKEIKLIETILSDLESSSIGPMIAKAQRAMSKSSANLDQIFTLLEDAYDKIEDARGALEQELNNFEAEEYRLEDLDDRLYQIRDLARKHNCTPSDLPGFLERSRQELGDLQGKILNMDNLIANAKNLKEAYFIKATILSENRQKAAGQLSKATKEELAFLEMKKATFTVDLSAGNEPLSSGTDRVRFIASTNPGNPELPIDKIASGGELSRFMLALRVALFDSSKASHSIIFDEIDVGISGSVADSIGERLKKLGNYTQVIVITHQPQVAGKAAQHILVKKSQHENHTEVKVTVLDEDQKKQELARMISGRTITNASLLAAKELMG